MEMATVKSSEQSTDLRITNRYVLNILEEV